MESKRRRVEVELADDPDVDPNESAVIDPKRLVLHLEKCINKNLQQRTKFAAKPEKYVDSEVDLDDAINQLGELATSPKLYPEFISLGAVASVVSLLTHENPDIGRDTINLLNDLFTQDSPDEEHHVRELVDTFEANQGLAALVSAMTQYRDADEDGAAVLFNVFSVLENVIELKPEIATTLVKETKLLQRLLPMVAKDKPYSSDKQYAAEILAMLTQSSPLAQTKVMADGGMDLILESLSTMLKRNTKSEEEREMILDLFNVLCSCLQSEVNKQLFLDAEGFELMMRLVVKRRWLMVPAAKVVDFAVAGRRDCCERLVDAGVLGHYFALLVKDDLGKDTDKVQASILSTLTEMAKLLEGERRTRLSWKLREDDYKKLWCIVTIFVKNHLDVQKLPVDTDYLTKLDRGLYQAQLAAQILAYACRMHGKLVVQEMIKAVEVDENATIETLRAQADNTEDEGGEAEKRRLRDLMEEL